MADCGLELLDFEDAGWSDPVFELADMAEHFATRHLPEGTWPRLAHATGLGNEIDRLARARALTAAFWLALTIRRQQEV